MSQILQASVLNNIFCINVTNPMNISQIYLTTCLSANGNPQPQLQHSMHSVFTFE